MPLYCRADMLRKSTANIGVALQHVRAAAEQFKDMDRWGGLLRDRSRPHRAHQWATEAGPCAAYNGVTAGFRLKPAHIAAALVLRDGPRPHQCGLLTSTLRYAQNRGSAKPVAMTPARHTSPPIQMEVDTPQASAMKPARAFPTRGPVR
jgi:hypothetical protein